MKLDKNTLYLLFAHRALFTNPYLSAIFLKDIIKDPKKDNDGH